MEENKEVLRYCPNFHKIVNFDYLKEDKITAKLIRIYKDYIFGIDIQDEEALKEVKEFDYVLNRYIEDYDFRKELKKEIVHVKVKKSCTDILKAIVESIIHIFDKYVGITSIIAFLVTPSNGTAPF